jgi:hypothetical protein
MREAILPRTHLPAGESEDEKTTFFKISLTKCDTAQVESEEHIEPNYDNG